MAKEDREKKSWIVALLLSIFLGWFGIDRFYMGYIGSGVVKLLTLGGLGVWWLIDLILIVTGYDFKKVKWTDKK
jgi:TM2 domain-containing membrane protein YozV